MKRLFMCLVGFILIFPTNVLSQSDLPTLKRRQPSAETQSSQSISWAGITFTLKECRYAGGLVTCYLDVTSRGQDRFVEQAFSMSGPVWTLTDNLANTFPIKDIRVGNQNGFRTTLVADLPTPLVITSEFRPDAKSINSLDLNIASGGQSIRYLFRNVSITNDSPETLSDKPRAEYNGITIAFESCRVVSGTLTCNFTALSSGKDSRTDEGYCIGCRQPRIVDNLANEYGVDKVIYGNLDTNKLLVANTLTPVKVMSNQFSAEATSVALFEIRFQDTIINFRNLPIDSELQPMTIGFAMSTLNSKKSQQEREAFETQCNKLQVNCFITVANGNQDRQINDIDGLLTQGVDILFIAPINANQVSSLILKAEGQGVSVIKYNNLTVGTTINLFRAICSAEGDKAQKLCSHLKSLIPYDLTNSSSSVSSNKNPNDLSETYGIINATIFNKKTGVVFKSPEEFFRDSSKTSFANLIYDNVSRLPSNARFVNGRKLTQKQIYDIENPKR
jgi:hypothetical protein